VSSCERPNAGQAQTRVLQSEWRPPVKLMNRRDNKILPVFAYLGPLAASCARHTKR